MKLLKQFLFIHRIFIIFTEIFGAWILFSISMTVLAWAIDIIPTKVQDLPMAPYFLMTTYRFVIFTSVPFLIVFVIVFSSDVIVLIIAMHRRKRHIKRSPKSSSISINTRSTSIMKTSKREEKDFEKGIDFKPDSPNIGRMVPDYDFANDLKLTIRCLSLTTFYFVSQLCTFVPGIIFMNKVSFFSFNKAFCHIFIFVKRFHKMFTKLFILLNLTA